MSNIVENIKNIRRSKGVSQESLAYDLGIDYSTYGKIERGQISLTVERLEKISNILHVSIEDIYKWNLKDKNEKEYELEKIRSESEKYFSEIEHLKTELELTKQQLSDKVKIIYLLEERRKVEN